MGHRIQPGRPNQIFTSDDALRSEHASHVKFRSCGTGINTGHCFPTVSCCYFLKISIVVCGFCCCCCCCCCFVHPVISYCCGCCQSRRGRLRMFCHWCTAQATVSASPPTRPQLVTNQSWMRMGIMRQRLGKIRKPALEARK